MTNRKIEYWVIPPEADGEFVANMEEVLKVALVRAPIPVVWEEPEDPPAARRADDAAEDAVVTH